MLNVIKSKSAFDTQTTVIGRPITSFYAHYFVVFDLVGEQAANTAKRAHRVDLFIDHLGPHLRLGHERACRACLHTFTTSHTRTGAH
ncbi:MAG: hypothetical protein RL659_1826, partial [Pseudomonadota bacterium]